MAEEKRKNLGRGLSALLGADAAAYASLDSLRVSKSVPIEYVHPGKFQPRHDVNDPELAGLAQSIAERGVLQPILVRRNPRQPNDYEIVAGERRWRAAQIAKLHELPVVVKELTDSEALEVALVENLQRHDLNPIEEAEGYQRLIDDFAHTQEQMSKVVGKSRSHVANTLRLLSLPEPVRKQLEEGALSAGHARALLNAANPAELAAEVVRRGLNVRQTELLARARARPKKAPPAKATPDADSRALERDLGNVLGLKVEIKSRGAGGSLVIHYSTLEQLDDVLTRLSHAPRAEPPAVESQPAPPVAPPPAKKPAAEAPPPLAVKLKPKGPPRPARLAAPPPGPGGARPPAPPPVADRKPVPPAPPPRPAAGAAPPSPAKAEPQPATAPAVHLPPPAPAPAPPLAAPQEPVRGAGGEPPADDPYALPARKSQTAAARAPARGEPAAEVPGGRPGGDSWVSQATRGELADDD
jgi:ParB family chromosome partitioning protein